MFAVFIQVLVTVRCLFQVKRHWNGKGELLVGLTGFGDRALFVPGQKTLERQNGQLVGLKERLMGKSGRAESKWKRLRARVQTKPATRSPYNLII
jgi:hypothetical protein